jgi:aconitate decarboxylase
MSTNAAAQHQTRALASWMAGSTSLELPDDVVRILRLLALDALGCGLLASGLPWVLRLLDTVRDAESPGKALVWGHADRFSPASAAMINGTAVQGFELDDVGPGSHFGSVTVTTGLALADADEVSGKELLRAIAVGIEVAARVADAIGREPHVKMGFHGPGLFGTFASAATAASLLQLDEEGCVHTLATAAQFAAGLMATHHGGMGKRLLAGKAAHSGTLAAQLSQHGFTNVDDIFEYGYGSFSWAFTGGRGPADLSLLTHGLGETYRIRDLKFKRWACRAPIHPTLDAVESLRQQASFGAADVARVSVALPEGSFKAVGFPYQPSSIATAQLNLQYCLAVLLLEGQVFIPQFREELLRRPDVLDLVTRIDVRHDAELDDPAFGPKPRTTIVQIRLTDGSTLERRSDAGLLWARDDASAAAVRDKFLTITSEVIDPVQQSAIIGRCEQLHQLAAADELTAQLEIAPRATSSTSARS